MDNNKLISVLNNLIETCKDGQQGFKESAEAVENAELKTLFYELGQQRSKFAGELQTIVNGLGGEPEDSGSVLGAIHRGWINLKSVVMNQDEQAILNEAEAGEDVAKKAYKDALDYALPNNVAEIVRSQYAEVKSAHDKVRDLRDARKAASAAQ